MTMRSSAAPVATNLPLPLTERIELECECCAIIRSRERHWCSDSDGREYMRCDNKLIIYSIVPDRCIVFGNRRDKNHRFQ